MGDNGINAFALSSNSNDNTDDIGKVLVKPQTLSRVLKFRLAQEFLY